MRLLNARVYTLNDRNEAAEAVAFRAGRIVAVGSTADIRAAYAHEPELDAGGRTVLPGLIDAHGHLSNLARDKLGLVLTEETSAEAIARLVAERARTAPAGEWVTGRGWDQNRWASREFPTRGLLDAAAPLHPVVLTRIDGHASWVNGAALRAAGIGRETADPPGGLIIRDAQGEPTGILVDTAQRLLRESMPAPGDGQMLRAIREAIGECLSVGLTEVHEMGLDLTTIDLYKRLIDRNAFPIRVYGAVGGRGRTWDRYREEGPEDSYGEGLLRIRSLKLLADGALGSRGAALLEPYSDDPKNRGLTIIPEAELVELCEQALDAGFQVCTHAIGDRANREVLNAYQRALAGRPPFDHRFRVEHAQILTQADLPRFKQLGVLPSMQASHCTSDMPWAAERLGEARLRLAYAWRSLLDTGVPILGGSDFPVESANPFLGILASVTRQRSDGSPPGGWQPEQRMTRLEAVRSYTTWAAYGAFEEKVRGRIAPGYSADLVVLSADPFTVAEEAIAQIYPVWTIVGGEIVHQSGRLP